MREVNNTTNSSNINFQGIQARKDAVPSPQFEAKEVTDLSKMPSEVIGRSQVAQTALEKDIAFLNSNPDKVEDLDRYCEYLMKNGYSYEQACSLAGAAAEEFYGM